MGSALHALGSVLLGTLGGGKEHSHKSSVLRGEGVGYAPPTPTGRW